MRKSVVILLHILYWFRLPPFLFILVTGYYSFNTTYIFYQVLPNLAQVLAFYTAYFFLFPYLLARKKFLQFALASAVTLFACYIMTWSFFLLLKKYYDFSALPHSLAMISKYSFTLYFGEVMSGYIAGCLLKAFISWYSNIRVQEDLKQKKMQAELALIKAQLNPHFLFNTLNNIDTMISRSPDTASLYLNKLSDILRFTLYESSDEKILLSTEIEYIQKYIDLQKIRTNNSRFVSFQIEGNPGGLQVAPLLFIPFIENAFKHTTNKKVEKAIEITIAVVNRRIKFRCSNVIAEREEQNTPGGLGTEIIKNRLALLYPDHELDVQIVGNRYIVMLNLL